MRVLNSVASLDTVADVWFGIQGEVDTISLVVPVRGAPFVSLRRRPMEAVVGRDHDEAGFREHRQIDGDQRSTRLAALR